MANRKNEAPSAVAAALGADVDKLESLRRGTDYHTSRPPHKPITVIFALPNSRRRIVRGMNAQTLINLCLKGGKGLTHADVSEWARYLPAYILELRTRHGLDIASTLEPHIGGSHARYVLRSPVQIVEVIND
jgi:hypothetical protein